MPDDLRETVPAKTPKTILVPSGGEALRTFIFDNAPIPVDVTANPSAALDHSDLGVLVVEKVDPALRAAATRLLTENIPYVVLVRRDVWHAASGAARKLLDEVQQDPRRKLIRFWRDRSELERTLCDEVLALDDWALVGQQLRNGAFVKTGSNFDQVWEIENTGFRVWEGRVLKELASDCITPELHAVPLPRTQPGDRVEVTVNFAANREPMSCRSVWQIVDEQGRLSFPWSTGVWCQVLAVL